MINPLRTEQAIFEEKSILLVQVYTIEKTHEGDHEDHRI